MVLNLPKKWTKAKLKCWKIEKYEHMKNMGERKMKLIFGFVSSFLK
jgi:hypothetical protein